MFRNIKEKIKNTIFNSSKQTGEDILAILAFAESSFFPIPPDLLILWLTLRFKKSWFRTVLISTVYSIAGGLFGYLIGSLFFNILGGQIVAFYGLEQEFLQVGAFFETHGFLTLFVAAFTPIPYKVFTLSAGLFKLNIFVFLLASLLGRFLRFWVVGFLAKVLSDKFREQITRYFNLITLVFGIVVLVFLVYIFFH